jgi:hypothetical protein
MFAVLRRDDGMLGVRLVGRSDPYGINGAAGAHRFDAVEELNAGDFLVPNIERFFAAVGDGNDLNTGNFACATEHRAAGVARAGDSETKCGHGMGVSVVIKSCLRPVMSFSPAVQFFHFFISSLYSFNTGAASMVSGVKIGI